MTARSLAALAFVLLTAACGSAADRPKAGPAQVDSVVPREVALARFREGIPELDTLVQGAASRDELVQRWVAAIETKDTAELARLLLTRAEFAWVYYPTTPQGLPPYDLSPALMWYLNEGNGAKGLKRLLEDRGGKPMGVVGYRCDEKVSREGENAIYGPCLVRRLQAPGDTVEERLFGLVLERRGRWKFVNYAMKYD
jgi:hypothetical protein